MFTPILDGVLLATALLVGAAIVISLAMLAASAARPVRPPHGGIQPDLPARPQPETDDAPTLALR